MKIHTKSWHYKVFTFFQPYHVSVYADGTTDCAYVSKVLLNLFLIAIGTPVIVGTALILAAFVFEPILMVISWISGHGFDPVLGTILNDKSQQGFLIGGCVIWAMSASIYGTGKVKEYANNLTYADAPKTSFTAVLIDRFKSWKGKVCKKVEFIDD